MVENNKLGKIELQGRWVLLLASWYTSDFKNMHVYVINKIQRRKLTINIKISLLNLTQQ